ncbi:hypothetical protein J0X19_19200 [Hymenobacter sp. BT186]|uniref:Uncharacterized protein n=1 Tax=Hymenobacter telluris TaxID=2816474 RepID=A0A939EZQ5_9BACT|nr:hypothetical protein [Hymenobacter telluris]MBO0360096.1 hypothetical protein [Hymenobacter telluris]MBW3376123.1 hypothetical protein [Hymenobacter norwichensis]
MLRAAQFYGTTHLLLDIRRRDTSSPEAATWITEVWLPEAVEAMEPARLRIAYFMSATRDQLMRTSPALQPIVRDAIARVHSYEIALFRDEGEAVRWLAA